MNLGYCGQPEESHEPQLEPNLYLNLQQDEDSIPIVPSFISSAQR